MPRSTVHLLTLALAMAMASGPGWAQTPTPTPFKPATAAQVRALKALYPPQPGDSGQPGRADAAYYGCMSRRVFVPLSRMLARPTPPTKDSVSNLIAGQAQAADCTVEGADYIRIKPLEMLEAVARYAETYRPPAP